MANEALVGAGQGAAAGSAAGPWGAVIGGAAGLAGSLLGKKKSKAPDLTPIINMANQSAKRQGEIATNVRGQLAPLTQDYSKGVQGLATGLQTQVASNANQYVKDQETASQALNRSLSDELKQRVLSTQPELQRQLREGLAASGQLRSGAAAAANTNLANELASQIGQGQMKIQQGDLQARQAALETAMQMNDKALFTATGMNKDQLQAVFQSGRQDLIDEASALIEAEKSRLNAVAGLAQNQSTYNLAAQSAADQNRNQLISSGADLAGSLANAYFSRKVT
jgi:hypothetical protein